MRVLIKGAGDLATGIACRLHTCGFQIIMTEIKVPLTVRRTVAFSRAVYEETAVVEGITGRLAHGPEEIEEILGKRQIAVIVDPDVKYMGAYRPDVVVDAILAKRNLGTSISDAELVIGVGPGFTAGEDCHLVVETKRGHYLGRVIHEGSAIPNTGIPGEIGGYSIERLVKATGDGMFTPLVSIGDLVEKGQIIAYSGNSPVYALMPGMVRGMLQPGVHVTTGLKCGDIDARCVKEHCYTVSDKARAIGGGVLEAILFHQAQAESKNMYKMVRGELKQEEIFYNIISRYGGMSACESAR
ncbi:selenium-dependent molybdenum cofactor biosynthesis protein YqeB [Roseburia hominis]